MLPAVILTGVCVMGILAIERLGYQWLERAIILFVAVIGVAYAIEMFLSKPAWAPILTHVLVPEIHSSSIYIAVSMLGATVMPHVIYLHSALVLPSCASARSRGASSPQDGVGRCAFGDEWCLAHQFCDGRDGCGGFLSDWGARLLDRSGSPHIDAVARKIRECCLRRRAARFRIVVVDGGDDGGEVILQGFLNLRISIFLRRLVTMIPAIVVIAVGLDPLKTLILSQAVLSFCLPFAMIPLLILTRRHDLMGTHANRRITNYLAATASVVILGMNCWLLFAIFTGKS